MFNLLAQAAQATAESDQWYDAGALGYMMRGGVFMWVILVMGVLALGVVIERYRALKMLNVDTRSLQTQVIHLVKEDDPEEALALCQDAKGPVPAILSVGLRKYISLRRLNYQTEKIEPKVEKAMEDYSAHLVAALERHLPILATVSSVAPMVGFLGTVQGMITSFGDIVAKLNEVNIVEAAAGGIKVALLTTLFGLVIGIPAYSAFNYFTSTINGMVLEVEESSTKLVDAVAVKTSKANRSVVVEEAGREVSIRQ